MQHGTNGKADPQRMLIDLGPVRPRESAERGQQSGEPCDCDCGKSVDAAVPSCESPTEYYITSSSTSPPRRLGLGEP
jgi:hypothetical protein